MRASILSRGLGALRRLANRIEYGVLRRLSRHTEYALYAKYRDATMVPRDAFVDTMLLCRRCTAPGAIVECGTWRGGMSAAMAEARPARTSYLFDSFEGLPPTGPLDGSSEFERDAAGSLAAPEHTAREAMQRSGSEDFHIVKGWFSDTIPPFAATEPQIAILRLDGDWYESTMTALEELFPLVADNGLVLIDDYGTWDGCTRAVHDYLSREKRPEPIRRSRCNVVFLKKRAVQRAET